MPTMNVVVDLQSFDILEDNEGSPDEPYIWTFFVKADGTTIDVKDPANSSFFVHSPAGSHGALGSASDDMEADDPAISIPSKIGRFATDLATVDDVEAPLDEDIPVIGVLVVALEEDATKTSAAEAGRNALAAALRDGLTEQLRKAIGEGQVDASPDLSAVEATATKAAIDAIVSESVSVWSFMPISSLLDIGGIIDPDDFVGAGVQGPLSFRQLRDAGDAGIPIELTLGAAGSDEGRYRVKGRVVGELVGRGGQPLTKARPVRFSGAFSPGSGGQGFVAGMTFDDYVKLWIDLGKKSPPADMLRLSAYPEAGAIRFSGLFGPGKGGQHFVAGLDFAAFVDLWKKLGGQSPPVDMIDFSTYVEGNVRRFAGVFGPGKGGQGFVAGMEFGPFVDLWIDLGKKSPPADLLRVSAYSEGGGTRFAGLFGPGKGGQHFVAGIEFHEFVKVWGDLGKQTPPVDLIDVSVNREGDTDRFAGVFGPGKGGQHFVAGMDFKGYVDLWKKLGSEKPPVDMVALEVK